MQRKYTDLTLWQPGVLELVLMKVCTVRVFYLFDLPGHPPPSLATLRHSLLCLSLYILSLRLGGVLQVE